MAYMYQDCFTDLVNITQISFVRDMTQQSCDTLPIVFVLRIFKNIPTAQRKVIETAAVCAAGI